MIQIVACCSLPVEEFAVKATSAQSSIEQSVPTFAIAP
jgi:hypothetical protein